MGNLCFVEINDKEKTMQSNTQLLGKGLYNYLEVAKLLHINSATVRRWADGYFYQLKGYRKVSESLIHKELDSLISSSVLSFYDLIELKFVSMFRQSGVSMSTIRAASKNAANRFNSTHPFAMQRFDTDGKSIFATLEREYIPGISNKRLVEELAIGQMVMEETAKPFFLKLEYMGNEVSKYRPMGSGSSIILDPNRCFGKPIDEKSGVPTYVLYQMYKGGESLKSIANWYSVTTTVVANSIEFEKTLLTVA